VACPVFCTSESVGISLRFCSLIPASRITSTTGTPACARFNTTRIYSTLTLNHFFFISHFPAFSGTVLAED
jgi:hypothetical protein